MNVCFQADADLDQTIVTAVLRREPGVDFQTASVAGLAGRSDIEVLSEKLPHFLQNHAHRTPCTRKSDILVGFLDRYDPEVHGSIWWH